MSFADLLFNTATVRRFTEGAADAYGNPVKTWADHLTNQPCRLVAGTGREIMVGAQLVVEDNSIFFNDIDITEQDKVIVAGIAHTYEVIEVRFRQDATGYHHKQCSVRRVKT